MYIAALEWYRQQTGTDFINVTTDPWTIHPIVFAAKPTLNVTFDEASLAATDDCDFPVKIQPWGWFVRQAYEAEYDQIKAKKLLGLDPQVLTFLLAGGSEGSQKISELLPHLLKSRQPLQIIVACGSNRLMLQQVKYVHGRKLPAHITLIPLGFTHKLERYMRAADLVVGKAGPNMLFESVATKTPFFAITHISGQEDGNLDIIRKYQLGYVEERIPKAAQLLQDIIRHPEQLGAFRTQLEKLATYNQNSKKFLLEAVKSYLAAAGK
jgi:UDP-N-acetylglucosamine:LPS N-acetylglucosamine transferase